MRRPFRPLINCTSFKATAVSLQCRLVNARSVCNKLPEIHSILYSGGTDVVLITESWLSDSVTNGLLDPEHCFIITRCDRKNTVGGGECTLVSKKFNIVEVPVTTDFPLIEVTCADIFLGCTRCRLLNVYRKPTCDASDSVKAMEQLISCLERFCQTKYPCIIAGDLNCPLINWSDCSAPRGSIYDKFLSFVVRNGFSQLVRDSTRQHSLLDIVLTNEPLIVSNVGVEAPLSNSDHCQVNFSITVELSLIHI